MTTRRSGRASPGARRTVTVENEVGASVGESVVVGGGVVGIGGGVEGWRWWDELVEW